MSSTDLQIALGSEGSGGAGRDLGALSKLVGHMGKRDPEGSGTRTDVSLLEESRGRFGGTQRRYLQRVHRHYGILLSFLRREWASRIEGVC